MTNVKTVDYYIINKNETFAKFYKRIAAKKAEEDGGGENER